jgi:hypothetical protein
MIKPNLENYEAALSGGHPNSLGNTVAVVDDILANNQRIKELYDCYFSADEVVRLRVSNAFKRVAKEKPDLVIPLLDKFISEISKIHQASTQWTFAQLFLILDKHVTPEQRQEVTKIVQKNLVEWDDWIVLNTSMETLAYYSKNDADLKIWLAPQLRKLAKDNRKSVANRAKKYLNLV